MKLVVKNLKKNFGKKEVLKDINFEFEKGKIYGLLGRNGAGKTTFFNCLNEDIEIDAGEFYIEDNDTKRKMEAEDVGYVLSTPNVPEFLTGREFLKFFIDINKKRIKEEIAISNMRKDFGMKTNKHKKVIYVLSSICAVFILGIGIFVGVNKNLLPSNTVDIGKTDANDGVELNINKIKDMSMTSLDADVKTIELENLPEEFTFMENLQIPEEYNFENGYTVYTRENTDTAEYNVLHDYILNYRKDDLNDIKIAFSEIEEPIRDYFIDEGDKVSKIGEVELVISQWKEMYIVTFEYNDIYFDIETTGITEKQLVDLLESIIDNSTK